MQEHARRRRSMNHTLPLARSGVSIVDALNVYSVAVLEFRSCLLTNRYCSTSYQLMCIR